MARKSTLSTDLFAPSLRALRRLNAELEQEAQESGVAILQAHGLAIASFSDLAERVPHEIAVLLLDNAVRVSGDPAFALRSGAGIERGDFGLFQLLTGSAATLGASMQLAARYLPLLHDGQELGLAYHAETAIWTHRLYPGVTASVAVNEYVVAAFYCGAIEMLGFKAPPIEIWMSHDAPLHHAAYAEVFGAPVRFSRECNAIVLPIAALDVPLKTADAVLGRVLMRYADELLARVPRAEPFVERIRKLFLARLARGVSLVEVADLLHMSESGVQRRLQAAGTSHSALLDDVRRERAIALLAQPELNVSEVAFQLGFAHRPAFHRAFKRWYGLSPTEHRERAAHSDFYLFYRRSAS